jgi:pimeloyl-ACP methyl ester carboxylesterase
MNHQPRAIVALEQRLRDTESKLFGAVGAHLHEDFLELAQTGLRVRVLCQGSGPPVLLLHGVSETAAVWAPLLPQLPHLRLLAVDLPGHGLSDPTIFRRGNVRDHARRLIDDIIDALELDQLPVIGHSLGAMFALWYVAGGSERISGLVPIGGPGVALPGTRVRMPLSLLTVRGLGFAVLRSPTPGAIYRRLLAWGMGPTEIAAAPDSLIEALRLSARRPGNARTVASLMHAIDRFRRPRPESVLASAELAAIRAPTTFILGSDDPYLPVERARPSIEQIPRATLHEVPAGHAPWLVDPERAARLIATHPGLGPVGGHAVSPRRLPASGSSWPEAQNRRVAGPS